MISALIPFRGATAERIRLWDHVRPLWEQLPGVEICSTDDGRGPDEPFSYATAANRCRALATSDRLVMFGADQIPPSPEKLAWIHDRLDQHPWTAVYAATRYFTRYATFHIVAGARVDSVLGLAQYIDCCIPILAMHASVYDDVGGMDERFQGWGAEDNALRLALNQLHPDGNDVGEGEMLALWHPPVGRDGNTERNIGMFIDMEKAAADGRLREHLREVRGR